MAAKTSGGGGAIARAAPPAAIVVKNPTSIPQQREERKAQRQKEFEQLKKSIPVGVRRHIEDGVYSKYAASKGKPYTSSGYGNETRSKDGESARIYLKKPSVMDKKAYTEYKKRRKTISIYEHEYLKSGLVQLEFNKIHENSN